MTRVFTELPVDSRNQYIYIYSRNVVRIEEEAQHVLSVKIITVSRPAIILANLSQENHERAIYDFIRLRKSREKTFRLILSFY